MSRVDINNNNTTPGRDLMIWTGDSVRDDGLWCGQLYKQTAALILALCPLLRCQLWLSWHREKTGCKVAISDPSSYSTTAWMECEDHAASIFAAGDSCSNVAWCPAAQYIQPNPHKFCRTLPSPELIEVCRRYTELSWAEVYLKRAWGTGGRAGADWCFWVNKNTFHIATL